MNLFRRIMDNLQKHHLIWDGPEGCFATNRISKDGRHVGYMYREQTDGRFPDSGWRFFEGTEDDEYLADPENTHIFRIQTICQLDPAIIPYLHAPYGTAWERNPNGTFTEVRFQPPEDE